MSDLSTAIEYLDDVLCDISKDDSSEFREGFSFARHQLRDLQLREQADCCDEPFPEQLKDSSWECHTCGTTLMDHDEPLQP